MSVSVHTSRLDALGATAPVVESLLELAPRGLVAARMDHGEFAQTVRGVTCSDGVRLRPEGKNLRYAAMATLGIGRLGDAQQRQVLGGRTATEQAALVVDHTRSSTEPGVLALAAWLSAEVNHTYDRDLFARISQLLASGQPLPTVDVAWMVTAAASAALLGDTEALVSAGVDRLLESQGGSGIYPHGLPAASQPRWRAHVGSFADQIYPVQALARAGRVYGRADWIDRANLTAATLCRLQGQHGQWWWHYDVRDGSIIERYPVYSVHQHAMAPMALFDLLDAGGDDHTREIVRGVGWLDSHPEVVEELVSPRWGVIWRKVGRREPRKAARAAQAFASMGRPGPRVGGLDHVFPPVVVDHECRPYELGWLLYAWLPTDPQPSSTPESTHV